jgi:hypothetical protein
MSTDSGTFSSVLCPVTIIIKRIIIHLIVRPICPPFANSRRLILEIGFEALSRHEEVVLGEQWCWAQQQHQERQVLGRSSGAK